jgi:hypothetical protein
MHWTQAKKWRQQKSATKKENREQELWRGILGRTNSAEAGTSCQIEGATQNRVTVVKRCRAEENQNRLKKKNELQERSWVLESRKVKAAD